MTTREATPADRDAILALLLEASSEPRYARWFVADAALVRGLVDAVVGQGGGFVLEADGAVQGVAGFAMLEHHYSGELYLEELAWYVRPAYRRRLGSLLTEGTSLARLHGISLMKVTAPAGVESVDRLYRRQGFEPLETSYVRRV